MDPARTIAELRKLAALTSDADGAQRVAFSPIWAKAREWLRQKLAALPVETHLDSAGNLWSTLRGKSERALIIGGHLDSVPNGGWLDGTLNVLAGLEILRRINEEYAGCPPITIRLVDWADEEGARFGKSLFGSSACAGHLDLSEARQLRDADGLLLSEVLREHGLDLERVAESRQELTTATAYVELHIEQGPVLQERQLALGTVLGTFGVERHALTFRGQAAHSGSTPMHLRRDALLAAARMSAEIYEIARRHGGVCTIGSCTTRPGIVTSVVEECRITLDQRHLEAEKLAAMLDDALQAAERFARKDCVSVIAERLLQIAPTHFHPEFLTFCDEAIRETCPSDGSAFRLPSGPLHDASSMARAGIPTIMMFVQSLHGISHNKIEDTNEEHLMLAVTAFDKLADKVLYWIQQSGPRIRGIDNAIPSIRPSPAYK